jgi:hypothetical protein
MHFLFNVTWSAQIFFLLFIGRGRVARLNAMWLAPLKILR